MQINPMVVDLSRYDNVWDWDKVYAAGIRGVINKATEGVSITDWTLRVRAKPTRDRGILYGAYHFLRPGSIADQVEHFLGTIASVDDDNLLLALDHEDERVSLDDAKMWLQRVSVATGHMPILYSGHVLKEQIGDRTDPFLAGVRLWLCHYSAHPTWPKNWKEPWLWQFTGDGSGPAPHKIDGIRRDGIDVDSFNGTPERLAAEWVNGVTHTKENGNVA